MAHLGEADQHQQRTGGIKTVNDFGICAAQTKKGAPKGAP